VVEGVELLVDELAQTVSVDQVAAALALRLHQLRQLLLHEIINITNKS
jgi:hypothetical protein